MLDVALIHHPVVNRSGEVIGSAITNLDLHDIARAGATFGIGRYWVVSPFAEQRRLAREIVDHWTRGYGSSVNPDRQRALELIRICHDLDQVLEEATAEQGQKPLLLATCARPQTNTLGYELARQRLAGGESMLLLFGTAWGLAPEILQRVDATLPPIMGTGEYNHLSVRSAVSIILDRLLGT